MYGITSRCENRCFCVKEKHSLKAQYYSVERLCSLSRLKSSDFDLLPSFTARFFSESIWSLEPSQLRLLSLSLCYPPQTLCCPSSSRQGWLQIAVTVTDTYRENVWQQSAIHKTYLYFPVTALMMYSKRLPTKALLTYSCLVNWWQNFYSWSLTSFSCEVSTCLSATDCTIFFKSVSDYKKQ